jgi:cytochrome c-type biogenesis protein CcmH/NrfG
VSNPHKIVTPQVVVQVFVVVAVVPCLPLLISGRWGWWEAWGFALVSVAGFAVSRALAARRHPDLLAERARMTRHADAEPWDKLLSPLVGRWPDPPGRRVGRAL